MFWIKYYCLWLLLHFMYPIKNGYVGWCDNLICILILWYYKPSKMCGRQVYFSYLPQCSMLRVLRDHTVCIYVYCSHKFPVLIRSLVSFRKRSWWQRAGKVDHNVNSSFCMGCHSSSSWETAFYCITVFKKLILFLIKDLYSSHFSIVIF